MRLIKYKVNKFRSVKGTDWIDVDQWACFVGINEAGKTNLLLPLWKFNPADQTTKIDLLSDYPRDEYSDLDHHNAGRNGEHFIETLFELSGEEVTKFNQLCKKTSEQGSETDQPSGEDITLAIDSETIHFTTHLLIKKDYQENFYIYLSNKEHEEISAISDETMGKGVFNAICEFIPRFVYYSEYGNLDSDLYLPHVVDNLNRLDQLRDKEFMKARTLKVLFSYLKLDPSEILNLGQDDIPQNNSSTKSEDQIAQESRNKQERFAKLDSAASKLTKHFQAWWKQGNYIFSFNADGRYFRIFVSDKERPEKIELESRSKGLQWFFSFFLVFLSESEDNHKDCILLLDEPGLTLHPHAQSDLIRFFNELANRNQFIYTTHLPFLVDYNNLDKVKAVFVENGVTKISNDLNKADKEKKAIQPVNAAIGITVAQSLFIGCDIVIVEGISDQNYLTMIKNRLASKGKLQLRKEIAFVPVGGVKGFKPVISIIQGNIDNLPFTLLDSDSRGSKARDDLRNGLYINEKDKVLEMETFIKKSGSEIEDLIPLNFIIEAFDKLYRPEGNLEVSTFDERSSILPQIEKFANDNNISLDLGWKVELSKKMKQRFLQDDVPEDLENIWIKLFKSLQPV